MYIYKGVQQFFLLVFLLGLISLETTSVFSAEKTEEQVDGDSFITALLADPTTLLPLSSDASSSSVSGWIYVSLLKYDKNLEIAPYAASSYEVLDQGKKVRFTLHKNILWQDGTPLTAHDVEFTYKFMIDPKTPTPYGANFKEIESLSVIDDYTVEVVYKKTFVKALETWLNPIVPKHILEGVDLLSSPLNRAPIGAGPYILESWKSGLVLSLKANETYFEGKPHIQKIVYKIVPDLTTMFLELRARLLDYSSAVTPQQYISKAQDPAFQKDFSVYKNLSHAYVYLGFNLKSPLFQDEKIRQAFAHAINKQDVIKGALLGQGIETIGPYLPEMWAYNHSITPYPYDVEKAKSLIREAGWEQNTKGIFEKNGQEFAFTLLVPQENEARIKTAVLIQHQLGLIGVKVFVRTVEFNSFINHFIMPGYFDAMLLAWTIPLDPDGYDVWHSSKIGNGGLNFMSYSNKEVDNILEKARETFDRQERKELYYRFQEILHKDQPYIFLYIPYQISALDKRFRNIEESSLGILHNFIDWWVPLKDQRYRIEVQ